MTGSSVLLTGNRTEADPRFDARRRRNPVEEMMRRILQNQQLTYELMAAVFGEEPIELPLYGDEPEYGLAG